MVEHIAYIGLGSNLDAPLEQVKNAFRALQQLSTTTSATLSPLYNSRAVGPGEQPDYVNAVAQIHTHLTATALLDAMQAIEVDQHRERIVRWGPRTIDLDLLLYDQEVLHSARLTVPHPEMTLRNFVLAPLCDLAPNITLPPDNRAAAVYLNLIGRENLQCISAVKRGPGQCRLKD